MKREELPAEDKTWTASENSMFRTRIPRSTNTRSHLVVAFFMFVAALIIAIYCAER